MLSRDRFQVDGRERETRETRWLEVRHVVIGKSQREFFTYIMYMISKSNPETKDGLVCIKSKKVAGGSRNKTVGQVQERKVKVCMYRMKLKTEMISRLVSCKSWSKKLNFLSFSTQLNSAEQRQTEKRSINERLRVKVG